MRFVTTAVSLALALGLLSTNAVFAGAPVPTPGAFMGDFNGDGRQDVLIYDSASRRLYVYVTAAGIAAGVPSVDTAQSALLAVLASGVSVVGVGDFNADGRADVLTETDTRDLVVLVNDSSVAPGSPVALDDTKTGSIVTPPAEFSVIGVADANDDGNADIYVTNSGGVGGTVYTYMTSASVGGMPSLNSPASGSPFGGGASLATWSASVVGDLNGDGRSDVMMSNTVLGVGGGNTAYTFITAADGISVNAAASGSIGGTPAGWGCCAAGNFTTGNASNDLIIVNENASVPSGAQMGATFVYALNDDGVTVNTGTSAASVVLPANFEVAGLGDFNNDGFADTLVVNTSPDPAAGGGSLFVFLNSGPGTVDGAVFMTQMGVGWSAPDFQGMSAIEVAAQ